MHRYLIWYNSYGTSVLYPVCFSARSIQQLADTADWLGIVIVRVELV